MWAYVWAAGWINNKWLMLYLGCHEEVLLAWLRENTMLEIGVIKNWVQIRGSVAARIDCGIIDGAEICREEGFIENEAFVREYRDRRKRRYHILVGM